MSAHPYRLNSFLLELTFTAVFLLSCTFSAFSQSDWDQVHIIPRLQLATDTETQPALGGNFAVLKKNVDLVTVPVTITDQMNRLVVGLDKNNFEVFEGKQQQEIRNFSSEDAPASVGIILDTSGSMSTKIERAREAVGEFCKTANLQDEFFMITFSDTPHLVADFTSNTADIQDQLVLASPKGRTSLLDAVYLAIEKMRQATRPKKALLIISDGGDNRSRYTEQEVKSLVKEADVTLYAIGIYDRDFPTPEEILGPLLLKELADATGGQAFTIDNPNDLPNVASRIGQELREQYLLAYRPEVTPHDGKWHKIKVKLTLPKGLPFFQVHARAGYYAPAQ
jgi:Ca-activated chloride channel homolog